MKITTFYIVTIPLFLSLSPKALSYEEMKFEHFTPCIATGPECRSKILGQGVITEDSPAKLNELLDNFPNPRYRYDGLMICFDSPGGNVYGGMELGRVIRDRGLNTCVEKTHTKGFFNESGERDENIWVENAICASACTLAFLGGNRRAASIPLGVHQFRSTHGTESSAQINTAVIGNYLEEMGVSRTLLDIASLTPFDSMTWLNRSDMENLGILERPEGTRSAEWSLISQGSTLIAKAFRERAAAFVSMNAYFYQSQGAPILTLELFTHEKSDIVNRTFKEAYLGESMFFLSLRVNGESSMEIDNVAWEEEGDSLIASFYLPQIFKESPEMIHTIEISTLFPSTYLNYDIGGEFEVGDYSPYLISSMR